MHCVFPFVSVIINQVKDETCNPNLEQMVYKQHKQNQALKTSYLKRSLPNTANILLSGFLLYKLLLTIVKEQFYFSVDL